MIPLNKPKNPLPIWLFVAAIVSIVGAGVFAQQNQPANPNPAPAPELPAVQPADAAPNGVTTETELPPEMTFLELLGKGRWFMLPIGLCSLLGLAVIFERLYALRKSVIIPPGFLAGLKGIFRQGEDDRQAALEYCRSNRSPAARVLAVGIRKLPNGEEAVEQGIEDAGANEVFKLRKNLRFLYGIASIAPMLGLLGTVWGMIEAFQVASTMGLGKADKLATGIYEALVTTFAGLTVAIPVLIFYFYFLGKIESIVGEMNDVCEDFVEHYIPATA